MTNRLSLSTLMAVALWALAPAPGCGGPTATKARDSGGIDDQGGSGGSPSSSAGSGGRGGSGTGTGGSPGSSGTAGAGGSNMGSAGRGGSGSGGSPGGLDASVSTPRDGGGLDGARPDAGAMCRPNAMCMGNMTCSVCGRGTRIPCTCMNGRITCNFQMGTADPTCATPDAGPPRDGGLVRDGGFTIQRCAAGVMNGGMCPANSAPCALTACTNGSHMVCRCNNGTWACASTMFGC